MSKISESSKKNWLSDKTAPIFTVNSLKGFKTLYDEQMGEYKKTIMTVFMYHINQKPNLWLVRTFFVVDKKTHRRGFYLTTMNDRLTKQIQDYLKDIRIEGLKTYFFKGDIDAVYSKKRIDMILEKSYGLQNEWVDAVRREEWIEKMVRYSDLTTMRSSIKNNIRFHLFMYGLQYILFPLKNDESSNGVIIRMSGINSIKDITFEFSVLGWTDHEKRPKIEEFLQKSLKTRIYPMLSSFLKCYKRYAKFRYPINKLKVRSAIVDDSGILKIVIVAND